MFSPQQDVEIGLQVAPDAEQQLAMLNDSRLDNYVDDLGRRLAAEAPGERYPYTFKVVNDPAINAFALPGGPVYINRSVIDAADSEAQLAAVLAHEISHVALRHGTDQASKASAAQLPLAILGGLLGSDSTEAALAQLGASFAVNSILLKYSRTAESQADIIRYPEVITSWTQERARFVVEGERRRTRVGICPVNVGLRSKPARRTLCPWAGTAVLPTERASPGVRWSRLPGTIDGARSEP